MKPAINLVLVGLILLSACSSDDPSIRRSLHQRTFALDSLGQQILSKGNVLGFSVSIDSAGKTLYNGNFGFIDADKTKPVDGQSRFDIASVSKMVGASVIMALIERGLLSLDQTLDELLPEFPEQEIAKKIKLRYLLSHTSGLLDNTLIVDSIFFQTGIPPERPDFLSFFEGKELLFEPGTKYQYCNAAYVFLAFIAENATKMEWQDIIDTYINEPAGLDFQLIKYAVDLPVTSPIFNRAEGGLFQPIPTWVYVMGDGGLTATTETLSKFPRVLAYGKILSDTSFREMVLPGSLTDGTRSGYGFGVRNGSFLGHHIIGHTGGWQSTYAVMAYLPELDLTFAGLMNTDGTPENINHRVLEFMQVYFKKDVPDYAENHQEYEHPEKLVGSYHGYGEEFDNEGATVIIKLGDQGELLYCLEGECDPLYYLGDDRFWMEKYPMDYLEFQVDSTVRAIREYYYGIFQVLLNGVN